MTSWMVVFVALGSACDAGVKLGDEVQPDAGAGAVSTPDDSGGRAQADGGGNPADGGGILPNDGGLSGNDGDDQDVHSVHVPGCGAGLLATAAWPTMRRCVNHNGRSPFSSTNAPGQKWIASMPNITMRPVVGNNGAIYLVDDAGALTVLGSDGKTVIDKFTSSVPFGSPTLAADGTVYVTNMETLLALNPSPLSVKWRFATKGKSFSRSVAVGGDGTIFVGSDDGGPGKNLLYAIHSDGTLAWTATAGQGDPHQLPYAVPPTPAIGADGTVFFSCNDLSLHAFAPDGTPKFTLNTDPFNDAAPISEDGPPPAIADDGTIYASCRTNVSGAYQWGTCAVSAAGVYKWASPIQSGVAIGQDGTIYGSDGSQGHVFAYGSDGKQLWTMAVSGADAPVIAGDGTIIFGADNGLLAFHSDGSWAWTRTQPGASKSPSFGADGTLYVVNPAELRAMY